MKKVGIIIICLIISLVVSSILTFLSTAVVRTTTTDVCHVYKKAGFPLVFIEQLMDQPTLDQCLQYALGKAYPTFNGGNLFIDWLIYFVLSMAGLIALFRKKLRAPKRPNNGKNYEQK